jgi:uncharacterized membrane protein
VPSPYLLFISFGLGEKLIFASKFSARLSPLNVVAVPRGIAQNTALLNAIEQFGRINAQSVRNAWNPWRKKLFKKAFEQSSTHSKEENI